MTPLQTYFYWAGVVWTLCFFGFMAAIAIEILHQKRQERHGSHLPGLVVVTGTDSSPLSASERRPALRRQRGPASYAALTLEGRPSVPSDGDSA